MRDTVFISAKTGITLKATDSESGINRIEYAVDAIGNSTLYTLPFHWKRKDCTRLR